MVDEARKAARHHERNKREARLSDPEEEDSTVIDQRALERASKPESSIPPRYKLYQRIIDRLPPWGLAFVIASVVAALTYSGALSALVEWAKK